MKQFNALASTFRIKLLLCCSATILLTACGGKVDGGSDQLSATAASVSTDAGAAAAASTAAPAAAVETVAEAAPAASTAAAPVASTVAAPAAGATIPTGQAAGASAETFALSGYGSKPLQAQTGEHDASLKQ